MTIVKNRSIKAAAEIDHATDVMGVARFSPALVSRASGVPVDTLRSWFKRDILSLDSPFLGEGPEGIGLGRKLTAYGAMTIAIMGQLTGSYDRNKRDGMSLEVARDAALRFVASGNKDRAPCMIYDDSETLLLVPKDERHSIAAFVVRSGYGENSITYDEMRKAARGYSGHMEILPLEDLWQGTMQTLGIRAEAEAQRASFRTPKYQEG